MDFDVFVKAYFGLLAKKMVAFGYDSKQLVDTIWKSTMDMTVNDGKITNAEVFWNTFCSVYGEKAYKDEPIFDEFYRNEFQSVKEICGFDENAVKIVKGLRENNMRVILATSPVFPAVATESRIRWAGLVPEDFELYTTYENCKYCKPNPKYYMDIAERLGLAPDECLMVGNDVGDDMVAANIGMKVFLLTDNLINKPNEDISKYPNGGYKELENYLLHENLL